MSKSSVFVINRHFFYDCRVDHLNKIRNVSHRIKKNVDLSAEGHGSFDLVMMGNLKQRQRAPEKAVCQVDNETLIIDSVSGEDLPGSCPERSVAAAVEEGLETSRFASYSASGLCKMQYFARAKTHFPWRSFTISECNP